MGESKSSPTESTTSVGPILILLYDEGAMDLLYVSFPVSGVETLVLLPPFIAFIVSLFASMGGVSGAFLLLPYQVSYLHFTSPSVSATNFVYNICAIPSGVYRYIREARMVWPLAATIVTGTLPGVFLGYYLRVRFLPDPGTFKLFAGFVLLYVGAHLTYELVRDFPMHRNSVRLFRNKFPRQGRAAGEKRFRYGHREGISESAVTVLSVSLKRVEYEFLGEKFSFSTPTMSALAFIVGIIGGAYGIGGGSILSPICVAFFNLPIYTVAGAALMGTFLTSVAGVFFYSVIPAQNGISTAPDWLLGFLFGVGGFAGMYCGARLQRHMPQKFIKAMLCFVILFLACNYIWQRFG